jgi:hypothetical protein
MNGLAAGLPSVASDIIGGVCLVAATTLVHRAARLWKTRAERIIWRPILKNDRPLGIILTCRRGPLPRSTHRTSISEVRALLQFTPTLEKLGIRYKVIDSLDAAMPDLSSRNLVILGGPAVNDVSRRTFGAIQDTMPVSIDLDDLSITIANRRYTPTYDTDTQKVLKDYGILIRCQNPYDPTRRTFAFLLMGCHGFGTAGTAQLLRNPSTTRQFASEMGKRDFVAITEVHVDSSEFGTRIIESFLLPRP